MAPTASKLVGLTVIASSALLAAAQEPLASKHFTYVSDFMLTGCSKALRETSWFIADALYHYVHSPMVFLTRSILTMVFGVVNTAIT